MLDKELTSFAYYRNAVERGWDPSAVDLSEDVEALARLHEEKIGRASCRERV